MQIHVKGEDAQAEGKHRTSFSQSRLACEVRTDGTTAMNVSSQRQLAQKRHKRQPLSRHLCGASVLFLTSRGSGRDDRILQIPIVSAHRSDHFPHTKFASCVDLDTPDRHDVSNVPVRRDGALWWPFHSTLCGRERVRARRRRSNRPWKLSGTRDRKGDDSLESEGGADGLRSSTDGVG